MGCIGRELRALADLALLLRLAGLSGRFVAVR
jgi:hypothetical protein